MEESIEVKGFVRAYATPFKRPSAIIVTTEKGDISIPVGNSGDYALNDKVELSVKIKKITPHE